MHNSRHFHTHKQKWRTEQQAAVRLHATCGPFQRFILDCNYTVYSRKMEYELDPSYGEASTTYTPANSCCVCKMLLATYFNCYTQLFEERPLWSSMALQWKIKIHVTRIRRYVSSASAALHVLFLLHVSSASAALVCCFVVCLIC